MFLYIRVSGFWLLCWHLHWQPSTARPLHCLFLQLSPFQLLHCSSRFSSSANISRTNISNSIAIRTFQVSDVNIFCTLLKKKIRIIGRSSSLSHLYAWLIYPYLRSFFEVKFLQNGPQTKFPSSWDIRR